VETQNVQYVSFTPALVKTAGHVINPFIWKRTISLKKFRKVMFYSSQTRRVSSRKAYQIAGESATGFLNLPSFASQAGRFGDWGLNYFTSPLMTQSIEQSFRPHSHPHAFWRTMVGQKSKREIQVGHFSFGIQFFSNLLSSIKTLPLIESDAFLPWNRGRRRADTVATQM